MASREYLAWQKSTSDTSSLLGREVQLVKQQHKRVRKKLEERTCFEKYKNVILNLVYERQHRENQT